MNIDALLEPFFSALNAMSGWELIAVILALAYLLLAVKERIECWYAAFFSTAIYIVLFWDVNLLMESALNVYYLLMAVYGWWQWQCQSNEQQGLLVHTWPLKTHIKLWFALALMVSFSGYLLAENTSAAMPYLDSFTTWGAVVTTYMVTKKVLENWLYWLVIDALSIYLYVDRELYLTAVLFVLYLLIACFGYWQWLQKYQQQQSLRQQCLASA